MGAREPTCYAADAHRVSRRPTWDEHGPGRYSPPLGGILTKTDSVSALARNYQRAEVAVANGSTIDIFSGSGVIKSFALNLGAVDEVATTLSYRGPYLYAASATDSKLVHVPTGVITAIGTAGIVDGLIASTADDSNPGWMGVAYTPPVDFLVEADAAGWEVYDLATGTPVSDLTQALVGISSLDYDEGQLYVGTATGVQQYDWVSDSVIPYTTATTPAIVNDTVNDVAATVLDSVDTTNLLSSTDDLSQVPQWGRTNCTVDVIGVTPCTGETAYRITGTDAFASILQTTGLAWNAGRYVYSFCMRQSPNSIRPCLRLQDGGSNSRTYEFVWTNGVPQFDNYKTATFGTPVDILYVQDTNDWWRVAVIIDVPAVGTIQAAIYAEYNTSLGADIDCSSPQVEQSATLHGYVQSITGPTTGQTPSAKQYVNEDIGGGVIVSEDSGLFVPTAHVETATDVSVIRDDGTAPDITGMAGTDFGGWIGQDIFFTDTTGQIVYRGPAPTADIAVGTWNTAAYDSVVTTSPYFLSTTVQATAGGQTLSIGTDGGLTLIDDPVFSLTTTTYNTTGMKDPDFAGANDTTQTPIVGPGTLTDNSGQGNNATVTGNANRTQIGKSGLYSVDFTTAGTITGTATAGAQLIGWEKIGVEWYFRRDVSEFENATDDTVSWTINALTGNQYAFIRYNLTPMTKAELAELAKAETGLIDFEPNGETC